MKVFYAVRKFGLGGTERRMHELYNSLKDELSCEVYEVSDADTIYEKNNSDQTKKYFKKNFFDKIKHLIQNIKRFDPDIIHAFDFESGFYTRVVLLLMGKKCALISGYGTTVIDGYKVKLMLKIPILYPDLFVCNNLKGAEVLKMTLAKPVRVLTIHNGLDPTQFLSKLANGNNHNYNGPVVGYIGKFDEYKHGERMVDIAIALKDHPLNPKFILVGVGPNLAKAKSKLLQYPELAQRVVFEGLVTDAYKLARQFSVGVLCSDVEGFPNVILEYMAQNIPCVSTDVGDVKQILDEGKAGLIIEKYDTNAFAGAITKLLENPELSNQIANHARQRFLNQYTIDIMKERYLTVYKNLLHH